MPRHSVCCSTVKSYQLSQMDRAQLKSVVSLVHSLVRNSHVRRLRMLPLNQVPVGESSLAPVSNKSLTDFSICSILGLEHEISQSPPSSGKLRILASDTPRGLSRGHHLAFLIIRNQFSSRCLFTISVDLGVHRKRAILSFRQEISVVKTSSHWSGIMKQFIYPTRKLSVGINIKTCAYIYVDYLYLSDIKRK